MKKQSVFIFPMLFFFLLQGKISGQDVQSRGRVHLDKLAADDMYGRGYLRNGYEKAVEYVEQQYAAYGLQKFGDKYRQGFVYPVNTFPDSVEVEINGKKLEPGKDFIVDPSSGSAKGVFKPVYFSLQRLFMKDMPVFNADQVVVIRPYHPKMSKDSLAYIRKRIAGFNEKAHVILLTNGKLTWSVADEAQDFARLEVMANAFDTSAQTIRLNIHNRVDASFFSYNVVGYVKAKKKNCKQYVVVTAHLDHLGMMGHKTIFNGANDNASGVALLLTLAEHYSKTKPNYNVVFIAFGGEEAGLIGSRFFVNNPLFDLKSIKFLVNIDLMGNGSDGITVVNATKFPKPFERLKALNDKEQYFTTVKSRGEAANSDHYWFTQAGVPSFFIYTMGGSTAYHDIFDRPEQLSLVKFNELHNLITRFLDGVK